MPRGTGTNGCDFPKAMERHGNRSWPLKLVVGVASVVSVVVLVVVSTPSQWFVVKCPDCPRELRAYGHMAQVERTGQRTNLSHIVFGIAGSAKTWAKRQQYSEMWWRPGETRGFVWMDEEPAGSATWPKEWPPYRISEDTSRFPYTYQNGSRAAVRLARIVEETVKLGMEGVRWIVMGDDDTLFFPDNLATVLDKYDHEEYYYIGEISESVEQDMVHAYGMAYGGGGYAVSSALAVELTKAMDGCLHRYAALYGGDERVYACVAEMGIPLTREPGFHQIDLQRDIYGFLAAHPVAPLVSLHHIDSIEPIIPGRTKLDALQAVVVASRSDPGRALQQTYCYEKQRNWTMMVSWGYTAQIYPWLVEPRELEMALQTFATWRSYSNGPFTFGTRPWLANPCSRPLVFFLEQLVHLVRGGGTHTVYARQVSEGGGSGDCDSPLYASALAYGKVHVFANITQPQKWTKAPHRDCCDVHDFNEEDPKSIQVNVRKCSPGESVYHIYR